MNFAPDRTSHPSQHMTRNPYIVGRWLQGKEHYGRQRLIDYLLTVRDPAIWVVGTRRMGKTSLLRQLEWLTSRDATAPYVPLFWDLQGCECADDLDYELFVAVEDVADRFTPLGVDVDGLYGMDASRIIRTLQRTLRAQEKQLLLLVDEAEALINVAANSRSELARLRKTIQNGSGRTIITATKLLMQLNELTASWLTSPFLFGFSLVNLWSLDVQATRDLITQKQGEHPVQVDEALIQEIMVHTHRHPYLTQYLCHRLFQVDEDGQGYLRPIREDDLTADHLLTGFLEIDFQHLAPTERHILLAVARHGIVDETTLLNEVGLHLPERLDMFLYGMYKLGYLREVYGRWTLGNEFLRRWVRDHYDELRTQVQASVSDHDVESLLKVGRSVELNYLRQELTRLQAHLDDLLAQRATYGENAPIELAEELQRTRRELAEVRRQLANLTGEDEP